MSNLQEFTIENGVLKKYSGKSDEVVIPAGVTEIGSETFAGCSGLTSVTIPAGVTSIGDRAFWGCSGLTSVTIPAGVTSIGDRAFWGCSGLTSVTIPAGVTSIGGWAFEKCSGLTSVEVDAGNPTYRGENNCVIEKATHTLVLGCKTSVIPSDGSVTAIGAEVFNGCSGLTSITIPAGVTMIGWHAFYDCSGLTSVTVPDSITDIDYAIGDEAFEGCTGLKSIIFQGTREQWENVDKGIAWDKDTGEYIVHCTDGDYEVEDCEDLLNMASDSYDPEIEY